MLFTLALFFFYLSAVSASCDNNCGGHGTCMTDEVCQCYDNWGIGLSHDSGDCSDRVCPYELAWIDIPDKSGMFHKYMECAGRGICNRATAECLCFDGYEGKGCQRTSCPNDCSGHGTCEYIEDLRYPALWDKTTVLWDQTTLGTNDPYYYQFDYYTWDTRKTRGCVCDSTYGDIDCSKRMCPHGNDVLSIRDDLLVSLKYQVQELKFQASSGLSSLDGSTFALTFVSRLNETFTTIPIVFDSSSNGVVDMTNDIHLALLNLPNRVIDAITVSSAVNRDKVTIYVTFTGDAVQGQQNLLVVEDYECSVGCTPKITGLDLQTRVGLTTSNITETKPADYNTYECGRRGKCDYSSGLCECFTGYTGDNCNTLTVLA